MEFRKLRRQTDAVSLSKIIQPILPAKFILLVSIKEGDKNLWTEIKPNQAMNAFSCFLTLEKRDAAVEIYKEPGKFTIFTNQTTK